MIFYTNSGPKNFDHGETPTLKDIALSLSRECRYAGASEHWWPVALHSFVVADLLPKDLKIYGLLHDAAESVTGDIPKPAKTYESSLLEDRIHRQILHNLVIPQSTFEEDELVHAADRQALFGEVWTVGTPSLKEVYVTRNRQVEEMVMGYFMKYSIHDCIIHGGVVQTEFINRFFEYRSMI